MPPWCGQWSWVAHSVLAFVIAAIVIAGQQRLIIKAEGLRVEAVNRELKGELSDVLNCRNGDSIKIANFTHQEAFNERRRLNRINLSFG